jgi:radical SAM protein with 4Fe4S-binding SPASM domain
LLLQNFSFATTSFYTNIFPLWKEQTQKGNWFNIKLYDDIIALFGFGQAVSCGINGVCHPQFVVEADGSVFPCDFYVLDEYRTGDLKEITLRQAYNQSLSGAFHHSRPALPAVCGSCPYRHSVTAAVDGYSRQCTLARTDSAVFAHCWMTGYRNCAANKRARQGVDQTMRHAVALVIPHALTPARRL